MELLSNGHILPMKFYSQITNGLEEPNGSPSGFQQKKDALALLEDPFGRTEGIVLQRHQQMCEDHLGA